MTGTVVDASVALAWCFPDEVSAYADSVLIVLEGQRVLVPGVWPLEITNALAVAERRNRLSPPQLRRFVELLGGLAIEQDSMAVAESVSSILPLAMEHRLSAYDASYLELAIRHAAPLATFDVELEGAARKVGVDIVSGPQPPKRKRHRT